MSLWKEPPTASCREKPGLEEKLLVVVSATSSNLVAIELQVSISISIPITPERMPRDLDGARIVNGEIATTRNMSTAFLLSEMVGGDTRASRS